MESENCGKNRGVEYVKCSDGNSLQIVKRDCGDYVEVTARGTLANHGDKPKDPIPNTIWISVPEIVLKFPKNLPEDMTERVKVLTQIRDEAVLKLAPYIIEAYAMASNPHQGTDEVNKLCEQLKNVLNVV